VASDALPSPPSPKGLSRTPSASCNELSLFFPSHLAVSSACILVASTPVPFLSGDAAVRRLQATHTPVPLRSFASDLAATAPCMHSSSLPASPHIPSCSQQDLKLGRRLTRTRTSRREKPCSQQEYPPAARVAWASAEFLFQAERVPRADEQLEVDGPTAMPNHMSAPSCVAAPSSVAAPSLVAAPNCVPASASPSLTSGASCFSSLGSEEWETVGSRERHCTRTGDMAAAPSCVSASASPSLTPGASCSSLGSEEWETLRSRERHCTRTGDMAAAPSCVSAPSCGSASASPSLTPGASCCSIGSDELETVCSRGGHAQESAGREHDARTVLRDHELRDVRHAYPH
jgi:hypothetical protein